MPIVNPLPNNRVPYHSFQRNTPIEPEHANANNKTLADKITELINSNNDFDPRIEQIEKDIEDIGEISMGQIIDGSLVLEKFKPEELALLAKQEELDETRAELNATKKDLANARYDLMTNTMEMYYNGMFDGVQVQEAKSKDINIFRNNEQFDMVNTDVYFADATLIESVDIGFGKIMTSRNRLQGVAGVFYRNGVIYSPSSDFRYPYDATSMFENAYTFVRGTKLSDPEGVGVGYDAGVQFVATSGRLRFQVIGRGWDNVVLQGSANGTDWNTLHSFGNVEPDITIDWQNELSLGSPYRYYRLQGTPSSSNYLTTVHVYCFELYSGDKNINSVFEATARTLDAPISKARLYLAASEDEAITYIPHLSTDGGATWTEMLEISRRNYPRDTDYTEYEYEVEVPEGSNIKLKIELNTTDPDKQAEIINYGIYFLT